MKPSDVILHTSFLVPGIVVLVLGGVVNPSADLDLISGVVAFGGAYLLGFVLYGITYYFFSKRIFRQQRARFFSEEAHEGALPMLAGALRMHGIEWPLTATRTPSAALTVKEYWIFNYCRLYIAASGKADLWGRISYSWELFRLNVTIVPALALAGVMQLLRAMEIAWLPTGGSWSLAGGLVLLALCASYSLMKRGETFARDVWIGFVAATVTLKQASPESSADALWDSGTIGTGKGGA